MWPRRRRPSRSAVRYFVVHRLSIESGATVNADGHPADLIVRLVLDGTWANGRAQQIPVILDVDQLAKIAAALNRRAGTVPTTTTADD